MHWRGGERRTEPCIEFWPIRYLCNYALHHATPLLPHHNPLFLQLCMASRDFSPACQFLARIPPAPQNKAHQIASETPSNYISPEHTLHIRLYQNTPSKSNQILLPYHLNCLLAVCWIDEKFLKSRVVLSEARLEISSSRDSTPNTMRYDAIPEQMWFSPNVCVDQMGPGHGRLSSVWDNMWWGNKAKRSSIVLHILKKKRRGRWKKKYSARYLSALQFVFLHPVHPWEIVVYLYFQYSASANLVTNGRKIHEMFAWYTYYDAVSANVMIWVLQMGESGQMVSEKVKWA